MEILAHKLVSGQEIIAENLEEGEESFSCKGVRTIHASHGEEGMTIHMLPFATLNPSTELEFFYTDIITSYIPDEDFINHYKKEVYGTSEIATSFGV